MLSRFDLHGHMTFNSFRYWRYLTTQAEGNSQCEQTIIHMKVGEGSYMEGRDGTGMGSYTHDFPYSTASRLQLHHATSVTHFKSELFLMLHHIKATRMKYLKQELYLRRKGCPSTAILARSTAAAVPSGPGIKLTPNNGRQEDALQVRHYQPPHNAKLTYQVEKNKK